MIEVRKQTVIFIYALVVLSFRVGLVVAAPGSQPWRSELPPVYVGAPTGANCFTFWHATQEPMQMQGWFALTMANCPVLRTQVAENARRQCDQSGARNSGWKQVGIYGLEGAGAAAVAFGCTFVSVAPLVMGNGAVWDWKRALLTYAIPSTFLAGTAAWGVGKMCGEDVSWLGGVAGTAIGAAVAASMSVLRFPPGLSFQLPLLLGPPIGALVGCNLMRWVKRPDNHVQQ